MSNELQSAMPDPNSNTQLPEGSVPPESLLGGDVVTQFTYRPDSMSFVNALAAVKADQEALVGYQLIMTKERSMELADEQGRYVEVFVTFSPVPGVSEAQMQADPSLRPPAEPTIPTTGDGTKV